MKVTISASRSLAFTKKLNSLNNKMAKYGHDKIKIVSQSNPYLHLERIGENGQEFYVQHILMDIDLDTNVFNFGQSGVSYKGTISTKAGILIESEINFDRMGIDFHNLQCDHCRTNRKRNKFFLFEKNGSLLTIGSTCADEYFGISIANALTAIETFKVSIDELREEEDKYRMSAPLEYIIAATKEATENFSKWIPKDSFETMPSVESVKDMIADRKFLASVNPSSVEIEAIKVKLEEAYASPKTNRDFNAHNALFSNGQMGAFGYTGVIAWAIYDAMRIKTEALQDSDFIGNIEDSVTLTGKVLSTKNIEGYYGMSLLVTFLVNGKDIVKTFTTCKAAYALEVGEEVSFSGIVKSHDTYMDKKSTMLKKIKIH